MRVELLCRLAYLLGCRGECDEAQDALDEAVEVERAVGRPPWDPTVLQAALADHLIATGDHQGALATAVRALEDGPSERGRFALHNRAAIAATALGDLAAAATWFQLVLDASLQQWRDRRRWRTTTATWPRSPIARATSCPRPSISSPPCASAASSMTA